MVERQNDASTFNEMPDWAGLTIDVIVEGQLIATEVSLARAGVTMMGSAATRVIPGVGLALEVGFGVIDVVGAVRNGTERDVVIQSAGLAGTVTGGTVATLLGTTVLTGSALVASSPLLAGAILAGAVVGTAYGVGKLFELAAASYYDRPIETDRLRAEKEAADSDSGHLKNAILMGIYNDPSIPKSPEVKRAEEALAKANKAKITNEKVSNGNEPIMDEDLFGIPGPGPAYGYNSNGYGASSTSKGSGSPTSGSASTKTKQESYADKYSGSGGGGGDSGKAGSAVSSKSTSSSKNEYGYEKTTTTTTYKSGVSQTTTKQTVSTPAGPKEVTKTTTKAAPQPKDDPKKTGPQPVLLDLDGNGVKITEYQNSTQFMTGKDGFQHRSSWAGAGDGVLFYDPDGRGAITEHRQYVFTEWNPTAAGDLEALRSIWDTNGDGKLTAADAEFAKFKVMVTNADGSTTVMTLAALGITEINLTANTVNIELPDGSVITGQTTFTRANGTTGTVANTTLAGDGAGSWRDRDRRLAA